MEEISIIDIFRILYRRRKIILFTILIGIVAAGILYFLKNEDIYEYSATIYTKGELEKNNVKESKDDNKGVIENEVSNEDTIIKEFQIGEQLTKDYISFLSSTYVLDNIQKKLKDEHREFDNKSYNQMNSYIKGKIEVSSKGDDSRFLEVKASDGDPDLAKNIVKFAAEELKESAVEVLGAGSVKIVDVSLVGESNKGSTNAGIVFVIFFMVGIGIVFISEFLNDSVSNLEDIEVRLNIKLIGDIP